MIEEIEKKIIPISEIEEYKKNLSGKKIVFTNGCFDILHLGHLSYLYKSKQEGDFFWLGLNSDSSVKLLKGESRPINSEFDRAMMLASLFYIDAVTIFAELTPLNLIEKIQPNLHIKGGDYIAENLPEYKLIKSYGGEVKILPFIEGKSTSNIISKIRN